MKSSAHKTAPLGQLVVAIYDEAARYSADPYEVSRLATRAVAQLVRRSRRRLLEPKRSARRRRAYS